MLANSSRSSGANPIASQKVAQNRSSSGAAALTAADGEIHPISDLRASEWYRRELVRNILSRMLNNVGER